MKTYDAACPVCGRINRNLYLEETDGWMECESCNAVTKPLKENDTIRIPIKVILGASYKAAVTA